MTDTTFEMPKDVAEEHEAWAASLANDPNEDRLRPDAHGDDYVRLLEERAAVDPLTGVKTRRLLNERMEQLLNANVRNIGFLFVDGNEFGQINKTLTQEYGDSVLQQTSRLLKLNVDEKTSEIFRAGGDEFVIFLNKIHSNEELDEIGNRLAEKFPGGNYESDGSVIPTVSIGGVFIGPEVTKAGLERALVAANMAMKDAKQISKTKDTVKTLFHQPDVSIPLVFSPTVYTSFQETMHGPLASLPRPKPFVAK